MGFRLALAFAGVGIESAPQATSGAVSQAELVGLGLATLDTILALPHWPEPDGRLVVDALVRAGGGPAATAAVAAARLGRSVSFVGGVGDDEVGETVLAGLREAGVGVAHVRRRCGSSPQSVILVDRQADTRTILHSPGVAGDPPEIEAAARRACLAAAWVHVDHAGWSLTAGLPRERLSVDGGNPIPELELAGLGLYAPSAAGLAERYPGLGPAEAVGQALGEGAQRVVVTLAGGGALAATRDGAWRVAAAEVEVVSTLGAGDVFHGALLAAFLDGDELPAALRRANVAAALSCRAMDGRSAIPSREELEAALPGSPPVRQSDLEE